MGQVVKNKKISIHPILMLLSVLVLAGILTYALQSGSFKREGNKVIPGTYTTIEKNIDWKHLVGYGYDKTEKARPAGLLTLVSAIPEGISKGGPLIFMVMFVGGMFGIFKKTGALDAGLDRLIYLSKGNIYILVPTLMLALSLGSSFLGLISEYLVILPILIAMAERLKLDTLFAVGMLLIAAKIGYVASVSNPIVLPIAQGIAQVPIFSGSWLRLLVLVVFIVIGISYLLYHLRRSGFKNGQVELTNTPLTFRQVAVLLVITVATGFMMYAGKAWSWHHGELSTFYIIVAIVMAVVGGLSARDSADAFIEGMRSMVLAGVLIGLAGAIKVVLEQGVILDTVIQYMSSLVEGKSSWLASVAIMMTEGGLDILIPSTSAKAAISMPILSPIGELSGLQGNTIVLAYLFGNGLMAIISPTSGLMLAMLAMAKVGYGRWVKFVWPLTLLLTLFAGGFLLLAVSIGY